MSRGCLGGTEFRFHQDALVSIVVPVYNVESYLQECLDSVLGQSYANLEIILVDDGSTDSSALICKKYAGRDSRVRYFHKENGGLSSARNFGLPMATGEYLMYVDSDDMIAPNMVELMMAPLQRGTDISVCGFGTFYRTDEIDYDCSAKASLNNMSAEDALVHLYSERGSGCAACAKLAKIELWRKVVFPEGRKFEDFSRIHNLFLCASSVGLSDAPLYFYRKRPGSITSRMSEPAACDLLESIKELSQVEPGESDALVKAKAFKIALECSRLISKMDGSSSEASLSAHAILKKCVRPALHAEDASALQKTRVALVCLAPHLGARVSRLFQK